MPIGIWNQQWLSGNQTKKYPVTEDSSGRDVSGAFQLPDDFLVELDLPVSTGQDVDPSRFFIAMLGVYATGFSVIIGYQPASGDPVNAASALIPQAGFVPNTPYALGGIGNFTDSIGKVVIGRLEGINAQPGGLFSFALANARIEPDCIRPIIQGVSSIILVNGDQVSAPLYGDIQLIADNNIQLIPVIVEGQDPEIHISAIQGEGLAQPCDCPGDTDAVPVYRINGVAPTSAGDMTILGSACLSVTAITNGLEFADTCSQPCCGCQELEDVTRDLEQFGSDAATLSNFINRLEASVDEMDMVVLGSKLNDQGCG